MARSGLRGGRDDVGAVSARGERVAEAVASILSLVNFVCDEKRRCGREFG